MGRKRRIQLTGLHHNTTFALYRLLRLRMAEMAREGCPFRGQVEIDESYFGPARVRGQRGRGAGRKTPVFSEAGVQINGIESFWSYAKRRHQKFNGLRREAFPVFLKETEFRFNNRHKDLYKILLKSCRLTPLRSPQLW